MEFVDEPRYIHIHIYIMFEMPLCGQHVADKHFNLFVGSPQHANVMLCLKDVCMYMSTKDNTTKTKLSEN